MDHRSEVEAKFAARHVDVADIFRYAADGTLAGEFVVETYKDVAGWDQYYRQGESILRHRCDGRRLTSTLTTKKRKSEASIADRHEIDLPLADRVPADDAAAFLQMTGWQKDLYIDKRSYILHLKVASARGRPAHVGVLALYDVWLDGSGLFDRYLEIEIDKEGRESKGFTHARAQRFLDEWVPKLQAYFKLGAPLNQSLYEIYAGGTRRRSAVPGPPDPPPSVGMKVG